jgi:hypothetical protein
MSLPGMAKLYSLLLLSQARAGLGVLDLHQGFTLSLVDHCGATAKTATGRHATVSSAPITRRRV